MLYVLGAAAVGVIAYAWLSSAEQSAMNSYHSSARRLSHEIEQRQGQLNSYRQASQAARDYYKHIDLHHNSVLTANEAFALYDAQKQMLTMLNQRIHGFVQQIIALKKQRDVAKGAEKAEIRQQLNVVRGFLQEAKLERANMKQQKETLLFELREINKKTRELKLYIRDNCGKKGRDWYQRGLERRSA